MNTDQYRGKFLLKDGKPILADELIRQKVIVLSDFCPPKEKKVNWWGALSWHSKTQIFVCIFLLGGLGSAIIFYVLKSWHIATSVWILAFFLMFLIWALEFRKRLDTDHTRNY